MDEDQYVILELVAPGVRDSDGPGFEAAAAAGAIEASVHSVTISRSEAEDLARKAGVTPAPAMPFGLVKPVKATPTDDPAPGKVAWGIEAVRATASHRTGKGIRVAVLDTGIDATHPAFGNVKVTSKDFVGGPPGDPDGHGTHCAGVIAGADVNGYRIGVAQGVSEIFDVRVLGGSGSGTDEVVRGILWALDEAHAHIISMSLGIDFIKYVERLVERDIPRPAATSQALKAYAENMRMLGQISGYIRSRNGSGSSALVVAATGNDSRRKARVDYTVDVAPPAATDGFISVAALERLAGGGFGIADFSNTGPRLSGPGVDVWSAWPGGGFMAESGTSMATPHVAGVAALWAEQDIDEGRVFDISSVEARLIASCLPLPQLGRRDAGNGLVQAPHT